MVGLRDLMRLAFDAASKHQGSCRAHCPHLSFETYTV